MTLSDYVHIHEVTFDSADNDGKDPNSLVANSEALSVATKELTRWPSRLPVRSILHNATTKLSTSVEGGG